MAYWQDARYGISINIRAWRLEGEFRLVYQSDSFNPDLDTNPSAMKYDFAALDGILFRIPMPATNHIKIIEWK
ncbi:hypothetical protein [Paraburkholderia humisilvae]|uniref:hypothetical protein n=1 Tax=Paraburkholderia humisilvae TaxID=627669 RepID=UPI0015835AD8|nr:hypothetical protein [Paraburkholderia humisilvae]